jgi:hypothetical protein
MGFAVKMLGFQLGRSLPQDNVIVLEDYENIFYRKMVEMRFEKASQCWIA